MKAQTSTKEKGSSIFEKRSLHEIYDEVKEVYLFDQRPWIVGYSGGKDSTAVLQLIWYALSQLPKEKRTKPVYVISTDTLVEIPHIVEHIHSSHDQIRKAAAENIFPVKTEVLHPLLEDSFWVNLLGRGYPAPQQMFRWCTERMKIQPADRFIAEKVNGHGEVVLVLGARKEESMSRNQIITHSHERQKRGDIHPRIMRHSRIPSTYVYAPLEEFTLKDVWNYLLQKKNPFGNNNRDLAAMYKSASDGECPLVVDDTTPPCGNSRFGCWVCTLVQKDTSMEAMIDGGEEWMVPLLEIRTLLVKTQEPGEKEKCRDFKGRKGQVHFNRDGSGRIIPGPYYLDFRRDLLRKLLLAQRKIQSEAPYKMDLIREEELHEIRRIWRTEEGDWADSVPQIYREVFGTDLNWVHEDLGGFSGEDQQDLAAASEQAGMPPRLLMKLIEVEQKTQGMGRRASVYKLVESVLDEEWRSKEEIIREHQIKLKTFG